VISGFLCTTTHRDACFENERYFVIIKLGGILFLFSRLFLLALFFSYFFRLFSHITAVLGDTYYSKRYCLKALSMATETESSAAENRFSHLLKPIR